MKRTAIIIVLSTLSLSAATAEDSVKPWHESRHVTGELLGIRPASEIAGISPFASFATMYAANVSGGIRHEDEFAANMNFGLKFDLGKMSDIPDVIIRISGVDRHGHSIAPAVGSEFDPMQVHGKRAIFLYELNMEKFFENGLAIKLGRLGAADDFIRSPLLTYASNNATAGIRAAMMDGVITSSPNATWGGRIKYQPSEQHTFQLGVYQLFDGMMDPGDHGANMRISRHDGVSCMMQYDLRTELDGRRAHVFAGMNNVHFSMREFGTDHVTKYLLRLYAHGEVELKNGLALFTSLAYSPHSRLARMQSQVNLGANWRGLIPARPADRTFLHVAYGALSNKLPRVPGGGKPDHEIVFEAGHRIQITPAINVQPVMQYIRRPGGSKCIDDAFVLGVQAGVSIF